MNVGELKSILIGIDNNYQVWIGKGDWKLDKVIIDTEDRDISLTSSYEENN